MNEIKEYRESELTPELAAQIAVLLCSSFSSPKTVAQRIEHMLTSAAGAGPETASGRRFVIWDGPRVIAHSRTFIRVINVDDRQIPVLALASVCSDPEQRGTGLGAQVTRRAFEQLGQTDWPEVSLFQTSVPAFYEKLGGRLVTNRFVNRLNLEDPESSPWRDNIVMIHPASQAWPGGVVDLNGPAY